MKTGNQEQICVKLDRNAVSLLELECGVSAMPRNRVINRAIAAYCGAIDIARGMKNGSYTAEKTDAWFSKVLAPWLLKQQSEGGGK